MLREAVVGVLANSMKRVAALPEWIDVDGYAA
jgi:hypothetical protein